MALIFVASLVVRPPPRRPDLFSVLVSVYSCAHFLCFLLYFHWTQYHSGRGSKPGEETDRLNGSERKGLGLTTDSSIDSRAQKQKSKIKSHWAISRFFDVGLLTSALTWSISDQWYQTLKDTFFFVFVFLRLFDFLFCVVICFESANSWAICRSKWADLKQTSRPLILCGPVYWDPGCI